jgi:hypothetical protein
MHQPNPGTLVGLYSPYPGAGKSTVADMLVREHGFVRVKMADGLKAMLRSLLAYQNLPLCKIDEMIEGGLKHQQSAFLFSKSPRYAMQTLGTEWGRDCMGEDFWVEVADAKVRAFLRDGKNVVIDDIRFENEYDYVRRYAGIMARIERPRLDDARPKRTLLQRLFAKDHSSEGNLEKKEFDFSFVNEAESANEFASLTVEEIIYRIKISPIITYHI